MSSTEASPDAADSAAAISPSEAQAPAPAVEGRLEKVRKVYVRDLQEKEHLTTVFLVTRKSRNIGRTGRPYLSLVLSDKTGDVDGRIFEGVEQIDPTFAIGDFVLVQGQVITFHGKPQVVAEKVERLDPEPIDAKEFTAPAAHDGNRTVPQIREIVERVHDPHVKALLLAFLQDPAVADGLPRAPAGKGVHHAYRGGLADHILSVMKLAQRVADHYPMADRDLLVAGAFLHDVGKVSELSYEKNVEYTDEGRLVGHLVMTAQKIHQKAGEIPHFPRSLEHHLTHLVLAHHGQLAHGSPKVPVTLEALLVHSIDLLDSQVSSWLELMARDPNDKWTEMSKLHDRQLWKGIVPTVRNKSPVEGRGKRRNGEKRRHAPTLPAVERESKPAAAVEQEPRREHPEVERKESSLPTFKPLSALAGEAPPSAEGKDPPAS